jgi:putative aminopeptidase FrvX
MASWFDSAKIGEHQVAKVEGAITHDRAFTLFKEIADTHAPSQTVSFTRGMKIEQLLGPALAGIRSSRFASDFQGTGNVALMLTDTPRAVIIAHADEISYLLDEKPEGETIALLPFCSHRSEGVWPARVLRYDAKEDTMKVQATGSLISRKQSDRLIPYLTNLSGKVEIGDRIIFDYPLVRNDANMVFGKVDNAAGVSACLAAILAVTEFAEVPPVWFVFPDEEEGPPVSNSTFARGARRLMHSLDVPASTLFVVVDGHDTGSHGNPGSAALFTEKESLCRGAVVPPHLYAGFKDFAAAIRNHGVEVVQHSQYVARSDSPALMERFRNILLLGYPVKDAHFDMAAPSTSLDAIVALSKAIAYLLLSLR